MQQFYPEYYHINKRDCCIIGLFAVWFLTSLAALTGMYHLWWTRERIVYLGKPVHVQRAAIFERAGLPLEALDLAKKADTVWPLVIDYEAAGSEVRLSYLKYLILPRSPSGSSVYRIEKHRRAYSLSPEF